jgi:hypothetical protein
MIRLTALAALILIGAAGPALAAGDTDPAPGPAPAVSDTDITIDAGALYMTRSNGDSENLVSTSAHPGTGDVFRSSQFEPGFVPGAKGRIVEHEDDVGFEVGGFFLSEASESAVFPGTSSVTQVLIETHPETIYGTGSCCTITGTDTSGLLGLDAHFSWDVDPDVTLYAGPRYILLTEKFDFFGAFGGGSFEDEVWKTRNIMWGAEIGARSELFKLLGVDAGPLQLNADVGLGVLDDTAHTDFRAYRNSGPQTAKFVNHAASQASLSASLAVTLAYPVTDMITLQGGYDLLYLSSAETATGQIPLTGQFDSPPTLLGSHFESVLYNGFEAGISVHL